MRNLSIEEVLTRGVSDILPTKGGLENLMKRRKITLYQGFDPSMPSLHLGNYVGVLKLSQFQRLGHKVIFLVGDFTGMIGDPSDKLSSRKQLTREQVLDNAKSWKKQIENILDFEGENKTQILYNSEWSDKISFKDLLEITSNFTVQQMIERDMFQERLKLQKPIRLHEFLYPVAQGYDSVAMDVDLEIGGSDQIFNMLAGRTLMKAIKEKEKYVLATKLLVDKEGKKVGKTTGNALFLDSSPENFFAGIMSFPDDVIELSFELLTEILLRGLSMKIKKNPLDQKKRLAYEVVKIIWGETEAKKSQEHFEKTFQKGETPSEIKPLEISVSENITVTDAVALEVGSKSEAKRLLEQRAIEVDGKVVENPKAELVDGEVLKIGKKKFVKVVIK
ncbi:tyrosine--tRNA ligase [Candidatus Woesebacteria bacterium RIFCSPHIGHO2_01_FULL_39_32]|uniref:Tyrosine--tRNA ligase n=2 Tax=Candidatus Woeseibacteriota TaxID=1752722 RepID=A0A0G0PRD2_9BACT|nr:MAG: Tyrosine-tRNA ligase [Candidatus Woesebacteria bacterium GW2011_GWA1_39_8]OGM05184.1 MAG: tyrosine--tRNA ligase [Candidatus Woesebacteria bacterium GWB1_37_5]OGM23853.1 MAG: tyrosine--tRNA ligase [Candidatus Woesebacteria bacterium RIFCSPHIGHO2_01_FULL_39_32]OGM38345.1 MAG: tyrosine--tRNA ligase [Candidatus Woesebacteria bacterium RIFCSPHIGHO2_12_FULL_38_11]OGM64042.1 MAG: tyrosine--tRNA ligase [Candidatus Woesebacteria bacterium RIFCSPLOWO2_01_FULL_39_25]